MHSYWPTPASKAGLTTSSNAQQLTAEQLHYQQLLRQHHLAYQQQLANNQLNSYPLPTSYEFYKNGYFHALSHQALANMAAANNLMNGTNQNTASAATTISNQPNVNTLLNSTTNINNASTVSTTNSSGNSTLTTLPSTTSVANNNALSTFAYNAHQQQQLNEMTASAIESSAAAFRAASAASAVSSHVSSAFQLNSNKKRTLSSASPYPDMSNFLDFSMLRCSPSSLLSLVGASSSRSPSATGSMGHLSGSLSPSVNSFSNPLSHLISSPNLFSHSTSPLGVNSSNSGNSGANTPNSLSALTSLGYNNLLAVNNHHHSAFTPHTNHHQNNLQFHYHNLLMSKMDYNGNSNSLSNQNQNQNQNQNSNQTVLTKLTTSGNSLSPTTNNLLFKNSTVELSPVSNPNSNSPKSNLITINGDSNSNNVTTTNQQQQNSNKSKQSSENASSDEIMVSSTSLEKTKSKNKRDESSESATSSGSSPSNNNGLSSSRSSQHSGSSDIVITNSAKEEPAHQETCCYWQGCGPREFNDHMELVKHVTNEHINKDKKSPHICKWPDCQRKLKPFKANYMLDVHIRCHTGETTKNLRFLI